MEKSWENERGFGRCKLLQEKKLKGSNWWRTWWNRSSSSTSFLVSQTQSFHKLVIPPRGCSCISSNGLLVTDMICRKPVFQTELDSTIFASKVVCKTQNLSATIYRTNRFLLLLRIAIFGLFVFFQQRFYSFIIKTSCFDCYRTCFTDRNRPAPVIGFRTIVRFVWSMLQTKHLHTDENFQLRKDSSKKRKTETFREKKVYQFAAITSKREKIE